MNDLLFMPSFSLEPNKLTSFNSVFIRDKNNCELKPINGKKVQKAIKFQNVLKSNEIKRKHHNFTISDNAYRTLKRRINWLYHLSKSRYVKSYSGKEIFNFKVAFVTLTLPSSQLSSTSDVTNTILNQFLTEIRQRTKMENYVWRLEFQKNGNVHYHLITDTYLDYYFVRKIWNRILSKTDYIKNYQYKMNKLSLSEYHALYYQGKSELFDKAKKAYLRGKSEKWSNPNSVDVKSVVNKQSISNYLAKYFSKDDKNETICNEHDTDENSQNIRLWFCSRSISKLNTISNFCEAVEYDIFSLINSAKEVRKHIGKYAICYYFEVKKQVGFVRKFMEKLLKDYSVKQGYMPAGTISDLSPARGST